MNTISTGICEQVITGLRGDYLAFNIAVNTPDCDNPVDLEAYGYEAEVWSCTRAVDHSNPAGGIVLIEKQADFTIELSQAEGMITLSLLASQTQALNPDEEYRWWIKWFTVPESIKTLAAGFLVVR